MRAAGRFCDKGIIGKTVAFSCRCVFLLLNMALFHPVANAQTKKQVQHQEKIRPEFSPASSLLAADTCFNFPEQISCKGSRIRTFRYPLEWDTAAVFFEHAGLWRKETKKSPLLKVKGNVMYDMVYRSNIDTPYAEKDVYQHTIQTYLDITWKDHYPFRVYITRRFGNSPLFRNYTDLNAQFNQADFIRQTKQQVLNAALKSIPYDTLLILRNRLENYQREYNYLRNWVNNPGILQRIVEERERQAIPRIKQAASDTMLAHAFKVPGTTSWKQLFSPSCVQDSLKQKFTIDSLHPSVTGAEEQYNRNKERIDSLARKIKKADSLYQAYTKLLTTYEGLLKKDISNIQSSAALKELLSKLNLSDSLLPKGYKTLFALQSVGIGRSVADYSELSAKNISINGFQATYMPKYYYAGAAGLVDYRFRDYIIANTSPQKQWLALVSVGKGAKEENHVHFTYYTGRRQLYNSTAFQQTNTNVPNYNLMGITIESGLKLGSTTSLIAEIAKSSLPYYTLDSSSHRNLMGNVLKMSDRSNEAYALKLTSFVPATATTVAAFYRHTGANFQSFSLFTTGAAQTAWSVKLSQPLFKGKLTTTAAIRKNDLVNTFTGTTYKSNAILKSIQAVLHIKKWPTITAGYFPSSQLTKLSDNRYSESFFYTLSASLTHSYKMFHVFMNSTLVFTRFYNESADSGFVYFNARNFMLSQSAMIGKTSLQANISVASNTSYRLYTIESNGNTSINKWLSAGGGIKYNRQDIITDPKWGWSVNARFKIPVLGDVQLMYDKGFLPGLNNQLTPNNIGRVTYLKTL